VKKLLYIPAFLTLFLLINVSPTFSQEQYVKVAGKIYQASDSTPMVANVRYEKLPYRGHSGDFTSSTDGTYEFWLQLESDYCIALAREGFKESYDTLTVVDATESGVMINDYYLKPIEEENFVLHDLIFARGSDVIQESSYIELDEFVTWLKTHRSLVVQLEGHTDVAGYPEANIKRSPPRGGAGEE